MELAGEELQTNNGVDDDDEDDEQGDVKQRDHSPHDGVENHLKTCIESESERR